MQPDITPTTTTPDYFPIDKPWEREKPKPGYEELIRRKAGNLHLVFNVQLMSERENIPILKIIASSQRIPQVQNNVFPHKIFPSNVKNEALLREAELFFTSKKSSLLPLSLLRKYYTIIKSDFPSSYLERACIRSMREHYRRTYRA